VSGVCMGCKVRFLDVRNDYLVMTRCDVRF
jgi:hypothetical protein